MVVDLKEIIWAKEIIHYGFLLLLITTIITIYTGYKYVINGVRELKKL